MDKVDRQVIQLYIEALSNDTNFVQLWNELKSVDNNNIITSYLTRKYQDLQEKGTSEYDLNKEFYTDIQSRGKFAFDTLVKCLQTIHPELAELISPTVNLLAVQQENLEKYENIDKSSEESESNVENFNYRGCCMLIGSNDEKIEKQVKMLCGTVGSKLIPEREDLVKESEFMLCIILKENLTEARIQKLQTKCINFSIPKLIIFLIKENAPENKELAQFESADVNVTRNIFIVTIYVHQGDHLPSVLRIIRKAIANNPGYDIRDIFHLVTEKLLRWGCKLNTESRGFPEFSFGLHM